jgi:hypothetical protein
MQQSPASRTKATVRFLPDWPNRDPSVHSWALVLSLMPTQSRRGKRESNLPKKTAAPAGKAPRSMSDAHKEALAEGREQGRAVRRYLEALEANKPRRGRKRTPEGIQRRLAAIEERMASADALSRLHLAQERMDLEAELASSSDGVDVAALEAAFIKAAGPYSRRKGIGYEAWRAANVEPRVLKAAGIGRGQ